MHLLPLTCLLVLTGACATTAKSTLSEEKITAISPKSATCDNPPAEGECATAKQAADLISASFDTYKVTSWAEQAAIVSLMAFESGDFKYNKNHFPGRPGQGSKHTPSTPNLKREKNKLISFAARNMQFPKFNKKYAATLDGIKDKAAKLSDDAAILDLLRNDSNVDFGSGAWFLTSQCTKEVRAELAKGTEAGWKKYIVDCVGTTVTDDRKDYWDRAVKALKV